MTFFYSCWAIDWLISLVGIYFFLTGIRTATSGSKFFSTWLKLFIVMGFVLAGGYTLQKADFPILANILVAVPAFMGLCYGLFLLMAATNKNGWK